MSNYSAIFTFILFLHKVECCQQNLSDSGVKDHTQLVSHGGIKQNKVLTAVDSEDVEKNRIESERIGGGLSQQNN
jgi:hypothetical protein